MSLLVRWGCIGGGWWLNNLFPLNDRIRYHIFVVINLRIFINKESL